ncbi:lysozyme C-1-like [Mantella aurantiaca]
MKLLLFLVICLGLYYGSEGKVYTKCDLYKIFKDTGLSEYRGHSAAEWICIAAHESEYNTAAVHDNGSSKDYGIFQINSKWWCNNGKTAGAVNGCKIDCKKLLDDDIKDDIECAKRVVRDPNGIAAWTAWRNHCRGKDLSQYTAGC